MKATTTPHSPLSQLVLAGLLPLFLMMTTLTAANTRRDPTYNPAYYFATAFILQSPHHHHHHNVAVVVGKSRRDRSYHNPVVAGTTVVDNSHHSHNNINNRKSPLVLFLAKKATQQRSTTSSSTTTTGGFGGPSSSSSSPSSSSSSSKKKKNSKKRSSSSSTSSRNSRDDYALFPALEPAVKETLMTATENNNAAGGEMPNEIYQRLDQIYGLGNFNYETTTTTSSSSAAVPNGDKEEEEEEASVPFSVQDLIAGNLVEDDEDNTPDNDNDKNDLSALLSQLPPFEKCHVLHADPLVIAIDDFFTPHECDAYVNMPLQQQETLGLYRTGSLTVGKDAQSQAQRTSTTWFNHYQHVPALMAKASRLLGLPGIDQWEEPQTVRYRRNEKFTWHLDALGPGELTTSKGGQRIATLLVYHTDLLDEGDGGATIFRDLRDPQGNRLKVQPKKGSALIFFPAAGGIPNTPLDIRTLHCGESVSETSRQDKWISQLWLRERRHAYQPTAPKGNTHAAATDAIADYCSSWSSPSSK